MRKHGQKLKALGRMATASSAASSKVCLLTQSPYYLCKVAGRGRVEEFSKVYKADPSRLTTPDTKGQYPLHVAAAKGHTNIILFIMEQSNCVLDAVDNEGDTALHSAVRHNQSEAVESLLQAGADHSLHNHHQMAPLHLACDLGHVDVIKSMLKTDSVDVDQRGEGGMLPLHYCAAKDHAHCATLLLEKGADSCLRCDMGYFPLHVAAKCAAAETLEVLIQQGMKRGIDRVQLLTFTDKENNMPLHAAVNGGNVKAVQVCLEAGAPVNKPQNDKSTPLHLACAQGNLDMLTLMHSLQQDNFVEALFMTDAMSMTPLHRAALFNHHAVVNFLLDQGADVNSKDSTDCTPLLLAASKGCWLTVTLLLSRGSDVHVRDHNSRNFLHLAIRFGGKLGQFFREHESEQDNDQKDSQTSAGENKTKTTLGQDVQKLLDEKDECGCTPLHYASKEGHLLALDDFIQLGATPSLKNNQKQSPFHFAARYGRYNTCRRLLDLSQGPNIINETDGEGLTGLHIAAHNGHTKIITLLLQKGAVIHRDNEDNTPLHHAAGQGWTQCMRTLLAIHRNLMDTKNCRGETALHLAAQNGHVSAVSLLLSLQAAVLKDHAHKTFFDYVIELKASDVAMAVVKHQRWEEVLISRDSQYGSPFLGLIEHMPVVCQAVLDRCQVHSGHDKKSVEYYIEYNYKFLSCPIECIKEAKKRGDFEPMATLNAMVRHGRVNCLSHPVCVSFLTLKWNTYGLWFYMLVLGLYMCFLSSLTYFVIHHDAVLHFNVDDHGNKTTGQHVLCGVGNDKGDYQMGLVPTCAIWVVAVYSGLNMLKEVIQMLTQRGRYFTDHENAFEWTLYVTSMMFAAPFLLGWCLHWQWQAGALAIFCAWFNLLVILQRFDFFGLYVVMFLEILRTLLQALCVFSLLIVAFGLAFYILLAHQESRAYSTPGLSMFRTAIMMLELDYMASFNAPYTDGDSSTLHFGTLTLFMVAVFVLLMPILLINLLIGLAVGDIESVQRNARLKRLAGQVELHSDMEGKMPVCLLVRFDQSCYRYFPNKRTNKLANILCRVTVAGEREESPEPGEDKSQLAMLEELMKQKHKVREMGTMMEKNNQLLKLIVQKMEIQTEDEAWDEGHDSDDGMYSVSSVPSHVTSNKAPFCPPPLNKSMSETKFSGCRK